MNLSLKELTKSDATILLEFAKQLNPDKSKSDLSKNLNAMFKFQNFHSFGLVKGGEIIAISSGWITARFYSGKQLELDNFIIDERFRSKGYGLLFLKLMEQWAKIKGCKTVELNSYVQNSRSHKFYFNAWYTILGFHFQKKI